jgi:hypothetical protein
VTVDLDAIRTNAVSDPDVLRMFVTQVVTFATTVQTAFSPDIATNFIKRSTHW